VEYPSRLRSKPPLMAHPRVSRCGSREKSAAPTPIPRRRPDPTDPPPRRRTPGVSILPPVDTDAKSRRRVSASPWRTMSSL